MNAWLISTTLQRKTFPDLKAQAVEIHTKLAKAQAEMTKGEVRDLRALLLAGPPHEW